MAKPAAAPSYLPAPIDFTPLLQAFKARPNYAALARQANTQAATEVNATVAPLLAQQQRILQQASERAAQQNAAALASSDYLTGLHLDDKAAQDFANAAAAQTAAARGFQGGLQQTATDAAAEVQRNLAANGSPQTAYNQGQAAGNALYGLGGYLPSATLDKAGPLVAASLRTLPAQTLGYGQQLAFGTLGAGQEQAAKVDDDILAARAKQASLFSDYLTQLTEAARKAGQDRIANTLDVLKLQASQSAATALAQYRNRPQVSGSLTTGIYSTDPVTGKVTILREPQAQPASPYHYQDAAGNDYVQNPDGSIVQLPGQAAPPKTQIVPLPDGQWLVNATTGAKIRRIGGVSPSTSGAPSGPPHFDATNTNARHIISDQYGNPLPNKNGQVMAQPGWRFTKKGDVVRAGSGSSSASGGKLTQTQRDQRSAAAQGAYTALFGGTTQTKDPVVGLYKDPGNGQAWSKPVLAPDGSTVIGYINHLPALTYAEALDHARQSGNPYAVAEIKKAYRSGRAAAKAALAGGSAVGNAALAGLGSFIGGPQQTLLQPTATVAGSGGGGNFSAVSGRPVTNPYAHGTGAY